MKYFITGSTGFIGTVLSKKLAEQGHQIRVLARSKEKAQKLDHPNIQVFLGDLNDRTVLDNAIDGVDGIFHLAAFAKPYTKDKFLYNRINAESAQAIFEIARKKGIKKIVFTSTAGTYGPTWGNPATEDSIRKIDFLNEYESTKFIAEKITKDYVLKGLDIVIVHPSRVYGPGLISKSNAVTMMIKNYTKGLWRIIPGNGKKIGNYVYIDDVVLGHILAMEKGKPGEQYLLGGENVSYENFFKLLRSVSVKNYRLLKIPVWMLKSFAAIQMQLALMFGGKPILPPKWVNKYMYDWEVSSQKAKQELNYKITPLEKGFSITLEWLKNSERDDKK